jgi:hypothetical protein
MLAGVRSSNNYSNLLYRVWKNLYSKCDAIRRKELLEGKKGLEEHLGVRQRKQEPYISHAAIGSTGAAFNFSQDP